MDVQTEVYLSCLDREEVLAGPTGRRRWPDAVKGRLVAESFLPGVSVREVAERNGLMPNRLSAWRGLARRGALVVPDLAGADFATVVLADAAAKEAPSAGGLDPIEVMIGGLTLRLDARTAADRFGALVSALKAAS